MVSTKSDKSILLRAIHECTFNNKIKPMGKIDDVFKKVEQQVWQKAAKAMFDQTHSKLNSKEKGKLSFDNNMDIKREAIKIFKSNWYFVEDNGNEIIVTKP